jgi:hypothetical protein
MKTLQALHIRIDTLKDLLVRCQFGMNADKGSGTQGAGVEEELPLRCLTTSKAHCGSSTETEEQSEDELEGPSLHE